MEPIEGGQLLYVREVDYVTWVKAIDKRTGMQAADYVALPFNGVLMDQAEGQTEEVAFVLMMNPEAAAAIVRGIADLLSSPHPPPMQMPGSN